MAIRDEQALLPSKPFVSREACMMDGEKLPQPLSARQRHQGFTARSPFRLLARHHAHTTGATQRMPARVTEPTAIAVASLLEEMAGACIRSPHVDRQAECPRIVHANNITPRQQRKHGTVTRTRHFDDLYTL